MTAPTEAARLAAALVVARVSFGLALLAVWARRDLLPHYEPLERAFQRGPASPVAMHWYGAVAVACAAAAVAFASVRWAARAERVAQAVAAPGALRALGRAAAVVMLVDLFWFGWAMGTQPLGPR